MSTEHEKQWEDLQELRRIYSLKDARTPSRSFTVHWLQLERALEGYRKLIQELNRLFALEDPRPLPDIALFLERMTREQRDFWELKHLYLLEDPRQSSPVLPPTNESDSSRTVESPLDGVENWLSENNLDPEAEVDPELWEMMPREILRQYFRKHGIEDDADEE